MDKQKFREAVADIMLIVYLPKIQAEISRFVDESYPRQAMAQEITYMVGIPVSVPLGELKIAESSNEFIDKIVDLVYVKTK